MNITMPRGDLRTVRFVIQDETGEPSEAQLDEIYFTVKASFTDVHFLFQKRLTTGQIARQEDGSYQFSIEPQDTDGLRVAKYVFDIELVGDGIKQTTVGELTLTSEVTFAGNEAGA